MKMKIAIAIGAIACAAMASIPAISFAASPNVVIMLADDMGFGELQCLNPNRGKIPTPQLDALAQTGLVFTDAHSGSSVCTPTRYGLMTGRYAWRTRLQHGVLTGGESLISEDRLTLAKMMQSKGYETAIVGKWHLGMLYDGNTESGANVPIGACVTHGPLDRGGFDRFWGFHHSRQMRLWIENDRVAEHLDPVQMLPRLVQTAVEFVKSRGPKDPPFLLYVPWNSPHSPVVPSADWRGKSGLNAHADFVMQTDDAFGRVIRALKETNQFENTLIVCSSDNGTSGPTSKIANLQRAGHYPSGELRGAKSDIWDGGHRVPLIVNWPRVIDTPRRTAALVCLTDVMATLAELVGYELPDTSAEDSQSFARVLTARVDTARESVVHHSIHGHFAIRQGDWKLICCPGSGGWSNPTTKYVKKSLGVSAPLEQLYDMRGDLGEQINLATKYPDKVQQLRSVLDQQIANGRSTPGRPLENDAKIVVNK